jgi:para-nitrobenzyl esterase
MLRRARPRRLTSAAMLLALAGSCGDPPRSVDSSARRRLGDATVEGFEGSYQNHVWLGLRYAEPPVGAWRFRAPRPARPRSLRALTLGAPCPQLAHPLGIHNVATGTPLGEEDCLFLNIYAPRLSPAELQRAAPALPVMVWIHGGGNVVGQGGNYEGGHLAQRERVLVVTLNYRLGPLGWFRHSALAAGASPEDASGNFGTLDVIEALRWVRQHIAAFGGDPENVTIFGESAGGREVISLLLAPGARGLFRRAISQSGMTRMLDPKSVELPAAQGGDANSAHEVLLRLLRADGRAATAAQAEAALTKLSGAEIARYLRAKTPAALLAAYEPDNDARMLAVPTVFGDGKVLPAGDPLTLLARPGSHADVPVMLGTNRDEYKTFLLFSPAQVRRFTRFYARLRDPDRYDALSDALSQTWKLTGADAPALAIAQSGGRAYVYRFDWDEEPTLLGADYARMLGAGHGMEIPFMLGHFKLSREANLMFTSKNEPGRLALSQQMMGYWAEFARSGAPGRGGRAQAPEWKPFGAEPGEQHFIVLDTPRGGGTRLVQGALDVAQIVASVDTDRRLRSQRERCMVFHELVRRLPPLSKQSYPSLGRRGCREFPFDAYPWQ